MAATLVWKYTGGAANSNPALSLGGTTSSVSVSGTAMNNIFANVSAEDAAAGEVFYKAIDLLNSGDAEATSITMWMSTETPSPSTQIDFGINDSTPINDTTSVVDAETAPAGTTFAHYNSGSKLSLPNIAAGSYARVWLRLTVTAGATNTSNDLSTFTVEYA